MPSKRKKPQARASASTPPRPAATRGKRATAKPRPEQREGPLESLGKAVTSPVRGTADEEEDEKP